MRTPQNVSGNRLLDALPGKNHQHVLANCEQVSLVVGEELCKPRERIRHVYFPASSFISLVTPAIADNSLEVGMVGHEGMLGISLILGVSVSPLHGFVLGAGSALRMGAAAFLREIKANQPLERRVKRYFYVLRSQLSQTVTCMRYHPIEARLAHWLLMSQARARADAFPVTHDFLARMLGVRRAGITSAAGALRKLKLIRYSRAHVRILNRAGLKAAACACYAAENETYERFMA